MDGSHVCVVCHGDFEKDNCMTVSESEMLKFRRFTQELGSSCGVENCTTCQECYMNLTKLSNLEENIAYLREQADEIFDLIKCKRMMGIQNRCGSVGNDTATAVETGNMEGTQIFRMSKCELGILDSSPPECSETSILFDNDASVDSFRSSTAATYRTEGRHDEQTTSASHLSNSHNIETGDLSSASPVHVKLEEGANTFASQNDGANFVEHEPKITDDNHYRNGYDLAGKLDVIDDFPEQLERSSVSEIHSNTIGNAHTTNTAQCMQLNTMKEQPHKKIQQVDNNCKVQQKKSKKRLKHVKEYGHGRRKGVANYKCFLFCGATYVNFRSLLSHLNRKHGNYTKEDLSDVLKGTKPYCLPNELCKISESQVKQEQQNNHVCSVCEKSFQYKHQLRRHEKSHYHAERSFTCESCGKSFPTDTQLGIHSVVHSEQRPYNCQICEQTFARRTCLKRHLLVHKEDRPFKCSQCEWSFKTEIRLKGHSKVHRDVTDHLCSECGKMCSNATYLREHMMQHTGDQPHVCGTCGKKFARPYNFKIHMRSHTGDKPYSCSHCGKKFGHAVSLKMHVKKHHQ